MKDLAALTLKSYKSFCKVSPCGNMTLGAWQGFGNCDPSSCLFCFSFSELTMIFPSVSAAGQSFTNVDDLPTDPLMPDFEDTTDLLNTGIFSGAYDDEDEGAEVDLNNL
ncbi:hypothetical protein Tco_0094014 [Tanacetum coccineum]